MRYTLYIYIIATLATLFLLFTACSKEDDVNDIFFNKTWQITGAKYQGKVWNNNVSFLYDGYHNLTLYSDGTCSGTFTNGSKMHAKYALDGKKHTIRFININRSEITNVNDKTLIDILSNTTHYNGDVNQMKFITDDDSYVTLAATNK